MASTRSTVPAPTTATPIATTTTTTLGQPPLPLPPVNVPPLPLPPVNLTAPTISGTPTYGQTSDGTWLDSPTSYAYQLQDCDSSGNACSAISGATSSSYTLQVPDVGHTIRSVVTASNSAGSASATSAPTAVVSAPPAPTASFTYSPTAPVTGVSVHLDGSTSTCPGMPCTYTWADDPPSGGGTPLGSGQTLNVTFTSPGTKYVTLTVTVALSRSASVEHDVVVTTAAPTNTAQPTISGTAQQGHTLTASNDSWTGGPTSHSYQWQDCDSSGQRCTNITGGSASAYTLSGTDVGHTVRVAVTASNARGSATATSPPTAVVFAAAPPPPSNTSAPVITGTAQQGQALSVSNGSWTNSPNGFAYSWEDCDPSGASCTTIAGAESNAYMLGNGDVGHTVRAIVTASNAGGSASATSAQTAVVTATALARTSTARPQITGTTTQGDTLKTSNGSWTGSPSQYSYAWQDCDTSGASCTSIAGATSNSYTLQSSDVGDTIVATVTATNGAGSAQATSPSVGPVAAAQTQNGCLPQPSACGYPDATNAGLAGCPALAHQSGFTASTPGATYSNMDISGTVTVTAPNVTFNCVRSRTTTLRATTDTS